MIYDFGVGGFDLTFTTTIGSGQSITVTTKIGVNSDAGNGPLAKTYIVIGNDGDYYIDVQGVERYTAEYLQNVQMIRLVFHNEFLSVYFDNAWVHTFAFTQVYHPEDPYVCIASSSGLTITNVRLKELSDWREAVYVDMETNTQNAIQSVILQRPVDILPKWDGSLAFVYDPIRDTVPLVNPKGRHMEGDSEGTAAAASDAVVYFTNVAVVVDPIAAKEIGFVTRMYRFPDLDNGAVRAAQVMQKRARQSMKRHELTARISPTLELGDIAHALYTASGTNRNVDVGVIVESLRYQISEGKQAMSITGRENA